MKQLQQNIVSGKSNNFNYLIINLSIILSLMKFKNWSFDFFEECFIKQVLLRI